VAACAIALAACGPGVPGEVIATTSTFAAGLTQDADFLYWRTQDALMRLPKQGGTPETILGDRNPVALTVFGDRVFWLDQDVANVSLRSAAKSGGDEQVLDLDENAGGRIFRNLATDGNFLYWANEVGQLRRAPVTGGDAVNFLELTNPPISSLDTSASSVAAIDGVLYATTFSSLFRFEAGAAPQSMIGSRIDIPEFVTLANPPDPFLYWVERGNGGRNGFVYLVAQTGGSPALLAGWEVVPGRLSTDGEYAYFATGAQDDRIRRARVSGSSDAEDFAGGEVGDPVVDGSHVFWIDRQGRVHRAPKSK
jgi:hypothetical protein